MSDDDRRQRGGSADRRTTLPGRPAGSTGAAGRGAAALRCGCASARASSPRRGRPTRWPRNTICSASSIASPTSSSRSSCCLTHAGAGLAELCICKLSLSNWPTLPASAVPIASAWRDLRSWPSTAWIFARCAAELTAKLRDGRAKAGEGLDLSLIAQLMGDKEAGLAIQPRCLPPINCFARRAPQAIRACACLRWRRRSTWAATRRSNSCSRTPTSS